jgi:hypothetical protein
MKTLIASPALTNRAFHNTKGFVETLLMHGMHNGFDMVLKKKLTNHTTTRTFPSRLNNEGGCFQTMNSGYVKTEEKEFIAQYFTIKHLKRHSTRVLMLKKNPN